MKDKQKLTATVTVFVAGGTCSSNSSELLPKAACWLWLWWPHPIHPFTGTALLQTSTETVKSIFTMQWMKTVVVRKCWRQCKINSPRWAGWWEVIFKAEERDDLALRTTIHCIPFSMLTSTYRSSSSLINVWLSFPAVLDPSWVCLPVRDSHIFLVHFLSIHICHAVCTPKPLESLSSRVSVVWEIGTQLPLLCQTSKHLWGSCLEKNVLWYSK